MAEKRVSVRLAAVGGRQVRAELEGVGEAGSRGFGRLSREMEAANARLAAFSRRGPGIAAAAAVAAAAAAGVAMVRSGPADGRRARPSWRSRSAPRSPSIQTLERAGELAGVSMSGIEQATKDLTRRPQARRPPGTGPAADALDRLGLSATDLIALPLDQRVGAINGRHRKFRACGRTRRCRRTAFRRGRLHRHFAHRHRDAAPRRPRTCSPSGFVVSEQDADQIERTKRRDLAPRADLARALEPAGRRPRLRHSKRSPTAMAAIASRTGPLGYRHFAVSSITSAA